MSRREHEANAPFRRLVAENGEHGGVMTAAEPPKICPWCSLPATRPVRDAEGLWTWACYGACNP